jgi:8-oxo-dGTP pyrophosphatase MutT (NUDIX family)
MKIAAGVLIKNSLDSNLFLAFKRAKSDNQGVSLPCGKSDDGEDPYQTARRECLEETGWTVIFHMLEPYVSFDKKDGFQVWIFSADIDEEFGRVIPKSPNEGEAVWATKEELISGPYGEFNRLALSHFNIT